MTKKINEHDRDEILTRMREIIRDSGDLSEEQLLIEWYEQLAANAGVSFPIWLLDAQMEEWERPYAEQGFLNFSRGMAGVL